MNVDGVDVILHDHYGSMYEMFDYESKIHNIYFNVNFMPSPEVRIFGMFNFNKAKGALEEVIMPDIEDRLEGDLEEQDFTFEETNAYFDLDYDWIRAAFGIEYMLSPTVTLTAGADYTDLTDNAGGYVYGDETGSYLLLKTGVRIDL